MKYVLLIVTIVVMTAANLTIAQNCPGRCCEQLFNGCPHPCGFSHLDEEFQPIYKKSVQEYSTEACDPSAPQADTCDDDVDEKCADVKFYQASNCQSLFVFEAEATVKTCKTGADPCGTITA